MKTLVLVLFMMASGEVVYLLYKDATKPAPDPFAKCVQLPSSDKANYWRCEK